jgi:NitT/TauT family transport system permease protein
MNKTVERLAPFAFGVITLGIWQAWVTLAGVPSYVLPSPLDVAEAYIGDYQILNPALVSTLTVTFTALFCATIISVALAIGMAASGLFRAAIQPWAVILQVTPVVAIAPLIILWVNQPFVALVVCAGVVCFFPILSNTGAGLDQTPADLLDIFRLNGATGWQTLALLRLPSALPYFLVGLQISGTLALVGAVVAEFVAGSGGFASGLAFQIIEASYRLEIPRMFAALWLLAMSGVTIYLALSLFARWAMQRYEGGTKG